MPLLPYLKSLNRALEEISNGELNVSRFYQELYEQDVLSFFLNEEKTDLSPDELSVYNYTGSLSNYIGSFFSKSYWLSICPSAPLDACKKTLYMSYKQRELLAYAMLIAVSLFMKVPENIEATIAFTTGTIAFNGVLDVCSIRKAIQKMFEAERIKGLPQENAQPTQNQVIKYVKHLWPSLANLAVLTSALTIYSITTISHRTNDTQSISSSEWGNTTSVNNTSNNNSLSESFSISQSIGQTISQLALQYSSVLSSILLPIAGRKVHVSYLQYRKEHAGIKAQKHFFDDILGRLRTNSLPNQTKMGEDSSHGDHAGEVYRRIITWVLDRVIRDVSYLPFNLRTNIRRLASLQIRNAHMGDTLSEYEDKGLQDRNGQITALWNQQSEEELQEIGRQFTEYLVTIEEALVDKLKGFFIESDVIMNYFVLKTVPEDSIRKTLKRLGFEGEQINIYVNNIMYQQNSADKHLIVTSVYHRE